MTLPVGFPYPLKQEVEIPLEQIIPNPDQPRQVIFKETIEELAASLKTEGQRTAAKARPLTEEERAAHPGAWILLIGGHRRRLAALLNGSKTLKCIVEDISPEDTFLAALMDNAYEDMSPWEWDLAIERVSKTFTGTLDELAARVNKGLTKVNGALKIGKAFNTTARALVNENLQKTLKNVVRPANAKNKGFLITENTLLVLADLEDPDQVQQALRAVLDDYLTADQAQKLVEHIQTGQPLAAFNPHKPASSPKPVARAGSALKSSNGEETASIHPGVHPAHTPKTPHAKTGSEGQLVSPHSAIPSKAHSTQADKTPDASRMSETETLLVGELVGISVMSRLKAKVKKNEKLTKGDYLLLVGHYIVHYGGMALSFIGKHLLKLAEHLWKLVGKLLKELYKNTLKLFGHTVYKVASFVMPLVVLAALVCLGWMIYRHGVAYPLEWAGQKAKAETASWFHQESSREITAEAYGNHPSFTQSQVVITPVTPPQPAVVAAKVPDAGGNQGEPLVQPTRAPQAEVSAKTAPADSGSPQTAAVPPSPTANSQTTPAVVTQAKPSASPTTTDLLNQVVSSTAKTGVAGDVVRHLLPF